MHVQTQRDAEQNLRVNKGSTPTQGVFSDTGCGVNPVAKTMLLLLSSIIMLGKCIYIHRLSVNVYYNDVHVLVSCMVSGL